MVDCAYMRPHYPHMRKVCGNSNNSIAILGHYAFIKFFCSGPRSGIVCPTNLPYILEVRFAANKYCYTLII